MTRHLVSLALCIFALTACSEWNTDTLGHSFVPTNSVVRNFTHAAYLEYAATGVRLWGPAAEEVTMSAEGLDVTIQNASDSLALIVYGYPNAKTDSDTGEVPSAVDASLVIQSSRPYALYLNGLSLQRLEPSAPAIRSLGGGTLHVVLPKDAKNHLFAPIETDGHLTLSGTGSLNIESQGSCVKASSVQCQHAVNVTLTSAAGHGIEALEGSVRSTTGVWRIHAAQSGIAASDSILLFAGDYQGTALHGSFLDCRRGAIVRLPKLIAASGSLSAVIDSTLAAQRYDSIQSLWQRRIDTLSLMADTLYQVRRNSQSTVHLRFTPRQDIESPWFLVSDGTVLASDTLHFSH